MAHVYIAQSCDIHTFEAERDDPSSSEFEHMASPQVQLVWVLDSFDPDSQRVKEYLEAVRLDMIDICDGDEGDEEVKTAEWKLVQHKDEPPYREFWQWSLLDGDELLAMVVVQKVEVTP